MVIVKEFYKWRLFPYKWFDLGSSSVLLLTDGLNIPGRQPSRGPRALKVKAAGNSINV